MTNEKDLTLVYILLILLATLSVSTIGYLLMNPIREAKTVDLTEITTALSELDKSMVIQITNTNKDLGSLSYKVNSLYSDVSNLDDDIDELEYDVDKLDIDDIDGLLTKLNELESRIEDLEETEE
jgi:peptidoglycan hydrolase CwlO-like protein